MKINGVEKLIPKLNNKTNYVVHIKALNQALKHGLFLKKVHRVVEFSPILPGLLKTCWNWWGGGGGGCCPPLTRLFF